MPTAPLPDSVGGIALARSMTDAELDVWSRDRIMSDVIGDFKYRAFVRYMEIWGLSAAISIATIRCGLAGTGCLGRSLGGMFGSQLEAFARAEDGSWRVADVRKLYPFIKRWPKAGILCARGIARDLRRQRDGELARQRELTEGQKEDRRDVAGASQRVSG